MFESDYKKVDKIYDSAYKQVEDNVKIAISMKHYKKSLDAIHNGIISGKLYENCNNAELIEALVELNSAGKDFIMQFIQDYTK